MVDSSIADVFSFNVGWAADLRIRARGRTRGYQRQLIEATVQSAVS